MSENRSDQDGCYKVLGAIGILVIITLIYFVLAGGADWLQLTLPLEVLV